MIKKDKLYHMIGGGIITYIVHQFDLEPRPELIYSLIYVIIASVIKEIYDVYKPKPSGFDIYDIVAAIFGSLLTIILISEIHL